MSHQPSPVSSAGPSSPTSPSSAASKSQRSEYLRHLALSRIYLDNIPRIRTSVLTQNERALEGLLYGADDFDLPIEDEVTQLAGATISLNFDKLLATARTLGFTPTYRHVALGWNQPATAT